MAGNRARKASCLGVAGAGGLAVVFLLRQPRHVLLNPPLPPPGAQPTPASPVQPPWGFSACWGWALVLVTCEILSLVLIWRRICLDSIQLPPWTLGHALWFSCLWSRHLSCPQGC